MDSAEILKHASETLANLTDKIIDVVDVKKPDSMTYAINLSKVVSKLSPLIGNMIEFKAVDLLN